ncbi:invasion associated locus B family protein [Shumkonia mesophila]|uniref:invasion associated locus B family protein n=1 Tax=Shumkonia mesophila TaxID=2838854 RepID=UPI002934FC46|nr:invasion associated locus B family protein [Shumkonia mesophila]
METARLFPIVAALLIGAGAAAAQTPSPASGFIDNFDDWSAFSEKENGKPLCYMASLPKKSEGVAGQRGAAYMMVTHRPAEKTTGEVSVRAGYIYKEGSEVEVRVGGGQPIMLFTDQGFAWTREAKTDQALIAAMKAGASLVVKGTSSRGTQTTDSYSLKGFTAALEAINKACGVK